MIMRIPWSVLACLTALVALACSESAADGTGSVQIFVVPEETITDGLQPGTEPENLQDGWTVTYDRYLVAIGNFRASRSDTNATLSHPELYVLDLKNAPKNGYVVAEFTDIPAARWDRFGFDIPNARTGTQSLPPTNQTDLDLMISNGYSVYYEGTASKDSDTISFKWGFAAGTSFDDCATEDGIPGFAVPSGGSVQVKPTIHGDHQYFDTVTHAVEITGRRAEWVRTCNADGSSELLISELKACDPVTAMPEHTLAGITDRDGDGRISVYDYVETQMRTAGDYQGDGECPTRAPLP
jgi:hypothetical protein